MSLHDSSLKNGSYFYITNRSSNSDKQMALTYTSDLQKPELCFLELDETSPDQIWMVQQISNNQFEIVHAYSTLVISANKNSTWMAQGNWDSNQLFFLQKSDPKNNPQQYWIKANKQSDLYLQYEGKLKVFESNPKASKCRWQLKKISKKNQIFNSVLVQFAYSGLYLDVPGSSLRAGTTLIQYRLNSRCNQRWRFLKIKETKDYMIVSVRSKMCLTVKGAKAKPGTEIVQDLPKSQSADQLWTLIHQGLSLYIIASKIQPGLFLGMNNNSMNQCSPLVLTKHEEYAFWRVIGNFDREE